MHSFFDSKASSLEMIECALVQVFNTFEDKADAGLNFLLVPMDRLTDDHKAFLEEYGAGRHVEDNHYDQYDVGYTGAALDFFKMNIEGATKFCGWEQPIKLPLGHVVVALYRVSYV